MFGALHAEDAAHHPVPQLTRRHAVRGEVNARRDPEPRVAEHGSSKLVGDHLRPNRTQRDRCKLLGGPKLWIDLLRCVRDVVVQYR